MYNVKELRKFPRIDTTCVIKYRKAGSNDEQQRGITKNLSANGIFFIGEAPCEVNALIEISVLPGTNATPPLNAVVEVIRVTPNESDGKFEIAGMIKSVK